MSALAHINMDLINSPVVYHPLEMPLVLRQQLHVIDKVTIHLIQLLQDTLRVVVRLATLKDLIDTIVSVFDKFAVPHIHQIREGKYLLMISLLYIHYFHLITLKELVEYDEGSLIIQMDLVDYLH